MNKKISVSIFCLILLSNLGEYSRAESAEGIFPHQRTNIPEKKNATVGNYLYLGVAPKFDAEDLKITSSKIGLTVRITGEVTAELKNNYSLFLYKRFKRIADAFLNDPAMGFDDLPSIQTLEAKTKSASDQLWLKIASPYSKHVLEGNNVSIETTSIDSQEYKKNILTALLRYYLQNQTLTLDSIPTLDQYFQDPKYVQNLSNQLFNIHLANRFTSLPVVDAKTGKSYLGNLTYVYPIAATAEGPFDQPREGIRDFGLEGNIDSRKWSDKWNDEFGGFPFLLIEWSGVAFHGPITNYAPLNIWYLRRDFVSHGCHRMDSSDIMELRALMPANLSKLQKLNKGIKHITLTWPDVTDWNNDGQKEVLDVQYYDIPTWLPAPKKGIDLDLISKKYMGDNAQSTWRKNHYTHYNKNANADGTPFYDPATGLYSGLPKYEMTNGKLVRNGTENAVPVYTFPYQANRIIQYHTGVTSPKGYDFISGKFPPIYFEQNLK